MGCHSQKAGSIFSAVQAEIYMGRGAGASRGFFRESDQVSRREQWLLNPGWLMISWGILLPFIYWGFFDNPRTGNPELNQPGFNGMMLRDFVATAHLDGRRWILGRDLDVYR